MLSRVLDDVALEVTPIAWRRSPAPLPPRQNAPELPTEVSALRAQVAELTAAIERQSRQAYEAGFHAGETAAARNLEARVRESVEKLSQTIADLASTRRDTIRRAEADTVRLSVEIARRVLHRELSVDPSALEALIKAALEKLQAQEVYRVRVHPDQEKVVRSCLEQMGRSEGIEVISDPVQPEGGAVFEISRGALDASVETQLREIERGLTDQLEARV